MKLFENEQELRKAALHKSYVDARKELRYWNQASLLDMDRTHAKARDHGTQTPELLARQKAEIVARNELFAKYNDNLNTRQAAEIKELDQKLNDGKGAGQSNTDQLRALEVKHESENDAINQKIQAERIEQKFQHLNEQVSSDGKQLASQRAAELNLAEDHRKLMDVQYQRQQAEMRQLQGRENNAREERERTQREERIQREREVVERAKSQREVGERAKVQNKPVLDARVPVMLGVSVALEAHKKAEDEHRLALERKQAGEQAVESVGASKERSVSDGQREFNDKAQMIEILAKDRLASGGFNESIDHDRSRAEIFADAAGYDESMDAAARASVERDWIPKEFAYAQSEVARREGVMAGKLDKINELLDHNDKNKIRVGENYKPIDMKDGYSPTLEDIEDVAVRLAELSEAEEAVRAFELDDMEFLEKQKTAEKLDPRVAALTDVKVQIEQSKSADAEHQAVMAKGQSGDVASLEEMRDLKIKEVTATRDQALEAAAKSSYVKVGTLNANSEFDRQMKYIERDYQAAVVIRTSYSQEVQDESRGWQQAALAVDEISAANEQHKKNIEGLTDQAAIDKFTVEHDERIAAIDKKYSGEVETVKPIEKVAELEWEDDHENDSDVRQDVSLNGLYRGTPTQLWFKPELDKSFSEEFNAIKSALWEGHESETTSQIKIEQLVTDYELMTGGDVNLVARMTVLAYEESEFDNGRQNAAEASVEAPDETEELTQQSYDASIRGINEREREAVAFHDQMLAQRTAEAEQRNAEPVKAVEAPIKSRDLEAEAAQQKQEFDNERTGVTAAYQQNSVDLHNQYDQDHEAVSVKFGYRNASLSESESLDQKNQRSVIDEKFDQDKVALEERQQAANDEIAVREQQAERERQAEAERQAAEQQKADQEKAEQQKDDHDKAEQQKHEHKNAEEQKMEHKKD